MSQFKIIHLFLEIKDCLIMYVFVIKYLTTNRADKCPLGMPYIERCKSCKRVTRSVLLQEQVLLWVFMIICMCFNRTSGFGLLLMLPFIREPFTTPTRVFSIVHVRRFWSFRSFHRTLSISLHPLTPWRTSDVSRVFFFHYLFRIFHSDSTVNN